MADQLKKGKAFEYACLQSLYNILNKEQPITINQTSSYVIARDFYTELDNNLKEKLDHGADAANKVILRLEPQLQYPMDNQPLLLSIQEDSAGINGDVRDLVFIRKQDQWEIGISCKHNHTAVKHSRLSKTIDFGNQWFDIPCTENYFKQINPIFDELKDLRSKNILWRDLNDKDDKYYVPLLNAFIKELGTLNSDNPEIIPEYDIY